MLTNWRPILPRRRWQILLVSTTFYAGLMFSR